MVSPEPGGHLDQQSAVDQSVGVLTGGPLFIAAMSPWSVANMEEDAWYQQSQF